MIRQQIIALFLTASVALPSCGLVKTPAEKVSEQIAALSELSPITEAAILEAEEAFEALSEEEQAEVENADEIAAARERLEEQRISRQKASARDTVAGEWVELDEVLGLSRPIVYWFGPLKLNASGVGESEGSQWTWDVSEDLSEIRLSGNRGKVTLDVIRDGAFTKLRDPNGRYVLVRAEDAESYVKARFVKIDITAFPSVPVPSWTRRISRPETAPGFSRAGRLTRVSCITGEARIFTIPLSSTDRPPANGGWTIPLILCLRRNIQTFSAAAAPAGPSSLSAGPMSRKTACQTAGPES